MLLFLGCSSAPQPDDHRPFLVADPVQTHAAEIANDRTWRKLAALGPVSFEGNKLVNVIDHLRKKSDVNFFVNWSALEAAGVEKDLPRRYELPRGTAAEALRTVLKHAVEDAELEPMDFDVIEGIVYVTSVNDLARKTEQLRVYDIRGFWTIEKPIGDIDGDREPSTLIDHEIWLCKQIRSQSSKLEWIIPFDSARLFGYGELVVRATAGQHADLAGVLHRMRRQGETALDRRHMDTRTAIRRDYVMAQPTQVTRMSVVDAAANRALLQTVTVDWDGRKIDGVFDDLSRRTGLRIRPAWDALEAAGVEMDLPITLHLKNLSARQVLNLVLEQAGAGAELEPIGIAMKAGVVHVSIKRALDEAATSTRDYSVHDLIEPEKMKGKMLPPVTTSQREEQLAGLAQFVRRDHEFLTDAPRRPLSLHGRTILRLEATAAEHDTLQQLLDALRGSRQRATRCGH